jgi:CubicO group peptidase (beta-lactamase class C family)
LGHLAGIQHYSNGVGDPAPPDDLTASPKTNTGIQWAGDYFIFNPIIAIPDTQYNYSTFGFNLIGMIIE